MENKNTMSNNIVQKRSAFALFITIIFVMLFSFVSYRIVESHIFSGNLNQLKYLHLQANIHMNYIKKFIVTNDANTIDEFILDDERFQLNIVEKFDNNHTTYYISLETIDHSEIRLSQKIIK